MSAPDPIRSETWSYDADSNLMTHVAQDCVPDNWEVDAEGRALRVTIGARGIVPPGTLQPVGTHERRWTRDGLGRVTHTFDDKGAGADVRTQTWYDLLGRVVQEAQDIQGRPLLTVASAWDGTSRRTATQYPSGWATYRQHDELERVTRLAASCCRPPVSAVSWRPAGQEGEFMTVDPSGLWQHVRRGSAEEGGSARAACVRRRRGLREHRCR